MTKTPAAISLIAFGSTTGAGGAALDDVSLIDGASVGIAANAASQLDILSLKRQAEAAGRASMAEATSSYSPGSDALIALIFPKRHLPPQRVHSVSLRIARRARRRASSKPVRSALGAPGAPGGRLRICAVRVVAEDYANLLRNCRLFLKTETLGALKRSSWGAAAFRVLSRPQARSSLPVMPTARSGVPVWRCNCAIVRSARVNVMGLATQFSVEHTVRDCADMGYRVRLFADCCASGDMAAHRASLHTLEMLADVVSSESVFQKTS